MVEFDRVHTPWRSEFLKEPFRIVGGCSQVLTAPRLGPGVGEDRVRSFSTTAQAD